MAVSQYVEGTRCEWGCFMGAGGGVEGNAACCTWQGGVMGELHGWHRHSQSIPSCTAGIVHAGRMPAGIQRLQVVPNKQAWP